MTEGGRVERGRDPGDASGGGPLTWTSQAPAEGPWGDSSFPWAVSPLLQPGAPEPPSRWMLLPAVLSINSQVLTPGGAFWAEQSGFGGVGSTRPPAGLTGTHGAKDSQKWPQVCEEMVVPQPKWDLWLEGDLTPGGLLAFLLCWCALWHWLMVVFFCFLVFYRGECHITEKELFESEQFSGMWYSRPLCPWVPHLRTQPTAEGTGLENSHVVADAHCAVGPSSVLNTQRLFLSCRYPPNGTV